MVMNKGDVQPLDSRHLYLVTRISSPISRHAFKTFVISEEKKHEHGQGSAI